MSEPVAGNHNDLFDIENFFQKMVDDMQSIGINPDGLFINADAGFDSQTFRRTCQSNGIIAHIDCNRRNSKNTDYQYLLEYKLYKERFSVERTNASIDAFKILLVRFETKAETWASLHYLAFIILFLRKHF